jgi:PAS domain-containing protein
MDSKANHKISLAELSAFTRCRQVIQKYSVKAILEYLETPKIVNLFNKEMIEKVWFDRHNFDSLRVYFYHQMKLFPRLSGIQWGSEEGDYIGILDLGNHTPTLEIKQRYLGEHKFAYSLDAEGGKNPTCLGCSYYYDPRTRPWYLTATERHFWSPIYQYSSNVSVQLGIMRTLAVYSSEGDRIGVLGCDIALVHISELLASIAEEFQGSYFLIDQNGELIGSSCHTRPFTIENGQARRLSGKACNSELLALVLDTVEEKYGCLSAVQQPEILECVLFEEEYLVDLYPLPVNVGLNWLLIICLSTQHLVLPDLGQSIIKTIPSSTSLTETNLILQKQLQDYITALKDSNLALRNSEQRWLLALQGTNDGLWDWHIETNEVFFSDRWLEISGYQVGELAHHFEEWRQHIHPDDRLAVITASQNHLQKKMITM